jgi:hypothetical protein
VVLLQLLLKVDLMQNFVHEIQQSHHHLPFDTDLLGMMFLLHHHVLK